MPMSDNALCYKPVASKDNILGVEHNNFIKSGIGNPLVYIVHQVAR